MDGFPIFYHEPLGRHVNIGVGGPADLFAQPMTAQQVAALRRFARSEGMDFRVLGGGMNLLISDDGVRGVVVKLHPKAFNDFRVLGGNRLEVGAAFGFQELVHRAAQLGLSGFEKLTGIPGSVGGVVRMNAGGKLGEIGDRIVAVRAVVGEEVVTLSRAECRFGYRDSALKDHIVIGAVVEGIPGDRAAIQQATREFARYKASVQPMQLPSAGCMFANPAGGSAGKLIDEAGLKGARVGGAMVALKHGNFLYNAGGATCADFLHLIGWVRSRVYDSFGVELKLEVQTWGCEFPAVRDLKLAA
ncbi:MAG: UDP-N-acetylmuramate dehydrogenase [Planctomycetota bacterium]